MSTVVRLFLDKEAERQVRSVLTQLKVKTVGKEQPTNGSQVINVFDPSGFAELSKRSFPEKDPKEQAVLVVSGNFSRDRVINIDNDLRRKGAALLGIVDPTQSNWQLYLKFLLR
jgi:hypothetical protein